MHKPDDEHVVGIYMTIRGAKEAMEFYKKVFGAEIEGTLLMKDGTIGPR